MCDSAISPVNVYLSRENGELVLRQGIGPLSDQSTDKHVLIIGGGVTGMTVCSIFHTADSIILIRTPTECLGLS